MASSGLGIFDMLAAVPMSPVRRSASAAQAQLPPDLVARLADFLVEGFVVCLFIALLTVAALHLLRPVMRKIAQSRSLADNAELPDELKKRFGGGEVDEYDGEITPMLVRLYGALPPWLTQTSGWDWDERRQWVMQRDRQRSSGRKVDRTSLSWAFHRLREARRRGFATRSSFLPDELFMRTIENEAKAVLARPSENPYLFALLTASAPDDSTAVAGRLDALGEESPAAAARLADPETSEPGVAAGIAAAQSAVVAAAESWLDKFQLSLASQSLFVSRFFALFAGLFLAALAGEFVEWKAHNDLLLGLGATGGVLGLLANDALSAFAPGARR